MEETMFKGRAEFNYAPQHGSYGTAILRGLAQPCNQGVIVGRRGPFTVFTERHVYSGTVTWETKQARRAANRIARKSRRVNRKRA